MFKFIKNVSITTFILFASWVFVMAIFVPAPADAIIFTAPPRTIQTGDVTSDTILDGTIIGADISSSASTTMFRLQVSDLSATSTTAISTFAGGLAVETSGFVYDYPTNNVGIGTAAPAAPLHINATQASNRGQLSIASPTTNTYMSWYEGSTWQGYIQYSAGNFIFQNHANGSNGNLILNPTGGNVGIGEIAPGSKLSVSGGATVGASYDTTAAPSNGMIIEGSVGIGTTTPFTTLGVVGTITTNNINATSTTATSTFMGGVGIGTTTPGSTLSINGDIFFNGSLRFEDGSSQTVAAVSADVQDFTGNGTYTKPANAKRIFVQLWAGGGGSGGVANNTGSGAGGGGSYKEYMFDAADVGATEAVTVGAAGAAGAAGANAGGAGGASSFGSLLSAAGGGGGSAGAAPNSNGGAGGAYGHDDTGTAGTGAAVAGDATQGGGGGGVGGTDAGGTKTGGDTLFGGGGGGGGNMAGVAGAAGTSDLGGNGGAGGNDAVGTAGTAPSGGGGGSGSNAAGNRAGAAGAVGQVKITTFF